MARSMAEWAKHPQAAAIASLPVLEIVKRDKGVQDAIQTNNLHMLQGIIEAAVGQGMHSLLTR